MQRNADIGLFTKPSTFMAYNLLIISNKLKLNYIYSVYKDYNAGGKKA